MSIPPSTVLQLEPGFKTKYKYISPSGLTRGPHVSSGNAEDVGWIFRICFLRLDSGVAPVKYCSQICQPPLETHFHGLPLTSCSTLTFDCHKSVTLREIYLLDQTRSERRPFVAEVSGDRHNTVQTAFQRWSCCRRRLGVVSQRYKQISEIRMLVRGWEW